MQVEVSGLLQMLNPTNTGTFNRVFAHVIGLHEALVYSALIAKFVYYNTNDRLTDDGFFFSTADDMQESTTLSRFQQDKSIDKLKELGLIDYTLKGMPSKRYFKVLDNQDKLQEILSKGLKKIETRVKETDKQDLKKVETKVSNNLKLNISKTNISNKTKDNKEKDIVSDSENDNFMKPQVLDFKAEFDVLWKMYPRERRQGKQHAYKAFLKAVKGGTDIATIKKGLEGYIEQIRTLKTEPKFIKLAGTWFYQEGWLDDYWHKKEKDTKGESEGLGTWL